MQNLIFFIVFISMELTPIVAAFYLGLERQEKVKAGVFHFIPDNLHNIDLLTPQSVEDKLSGDDTVPMHAERRSSQS